jgi:quinol monooxygenase YgiN
LSEIKGVNRFKFHEGKVEEFKRLSAQAMDIVRAKDTGTLQYEIYFNEDQSECVVYERYRDSEAVIEHGAHVGHLNEAIFATGSVSSELLGEPSAELTRDDRRQRSPALQALPVHAGTARWLRRARSRICGHPTTQVGQERDRLTDWIRR